MVFYRSGYDVAPFIAKTAGCAEDRQISALGPAAREHHFARLAAPDLGDPIASVIKQRAGATAYVMHAGRIAVDFAKVRKHRFTHLRVQGRGGVVVEIDAPHGSNLEGIPGETILDSVEMRAANIERLG